MGKKTIALAALLLPLAASPSLPASAQRAQIPPRCLHGPSEQPAQRDRREQALKLAQEINRAENSGPIIIPGRPRAFKPLDQLENVPPAPPGFSLQLNSDGATYNFSVKDTLDPCHYAIFSDQDSHLYEAIARTEVVLRPLEMRK